MIRMMHTLLGTDGFRKGMDLYFQRHDGQAVTCDDFCKGDGGCEINMISLASGFGISNQELRS